MSAVAWCVLLAAAVSALRSLSVHGWAVEAVLLGGLSSLLACALAVLFEARLADARVRSVHFVGWLLLSAGLTVWWSSQITDATELSRRGALLRAGLSCVGLAASWLLARCTARITLLHRLGGGGSVALVGLLLFAVSSLTQRQFQDLNFPPWGWIQALLHPVLLAVGAIGLSSATKVTKTHQLAAAVVTAAALPVMGMADQTARGYAEAMEARGASLHYVRVARRLSDFDGDGFSALFIGGDCDDADSEAYPLGPTDCEGILARTPPSPVPALPIAPVDRILLVTIDALRCEVGGVQLCGDIEARARDSSVHGTHRVYSGSTLASLSALMGGSVTMASDRSAPAYLPRVASERGYWTKFFMAYPLMRAPAIGGLFDELDTRLADGRRTESDVRSGMATDGVLEDLRRGLAERQKLLLWVHYLEPHQPHLPTEEGETPGYFYFGRQRLYSAEVARTDRDVARLLDGAASLGFDRNAAVVVTADHGEALGEHGAFYHGTTLYDSEILVPLWVWIFDDTGQLVRVDLPEPTPTKHLAALLAALVGAPPPEGQADATITSTTPGLAVTVTDGTFKLIYHWTDRYQQLFNVRSDPTESHNLVRSHAAELSRLRARLGAELPAVLGHVRTTPR